MSLQQLDMITGLLRASAAAAPSSLLEMRAGFEQMVTVFPVEPSTRLEPVTAGTVRFEWILSASA